VFRSKQFVTPQLLFNLVTKYPRSRE